MIWLLLALLETDCARLRTICQSPTAGRPGPAWCKDGDLEEWCPLEGAGLTVEGEMPTPPPPLPKPVRLVQELAPTAAAAPSPAPRTGPTDLLEVRCSPRQGLNGYVAQVLIRIERPVLLYCPEVIVEWPDGTRSGPRQADCEPLEEGEEAEPWSGGELWPDGLRLRVAGEMTVRVRVKAGKAERRGECKVEGH